MSMIGLLSETALLYQSFVPSKEDWQKRIEEQQDLWHNKYKHYPRKKKKILKKVILYEISFLKSMQKMSFDF